jgi:hypothetical protein
MSIRKNMLKKLKRCNDRDDLQTVINVLTEHERDLLIPCPAKACPAGYNEECVGTEKGIVHFGRRLKRLLDGVKTESEKGIASYLTKPELNTEWVDYSIDCSCGKTVFVHIQRGSLSKPVSAKCKNCSSTGKIETILKKINQKEAEALFKRYQKLQESEV